MEHFARLEMFTEHSFFGLVSGAKWQYAARAAVVTMLGSFGGGVFGLLYSLARFKGKLDIMDMINSILGALVSITAGCFLYHSWEALLIGVIGGAVACLTMPLVDLMGVDDPVGASSVHGFCGIWGVIAVGLFADNPEPLDTTRGRSGLFKGGGWYLLGVQCLTALLLTVWGLTSTSILLWFISLFRNIRMTAKEELLGADLTEHMIRHGQDDIAIALQILRPHMDVEDLIDTIPIGSNPGHKIHMAQYYQPKQIQPEPKFGNVGNSSFKVNTHPLDMINRPQSIFPLSSSKSLQFEKEIQRYGAYNNYNDMQVERRDYLANANEIRPVFTNDVLRPRNDIIEFNGESYRVLKMPQKKSGKVFKNIRSMEKVIKLNNSDLKRIDRRFWVPRPNTVTSEEHSRMGWIQ